MINHSQRFLDDVQIDLMKNDIGNDHLINNMLSELNDEHLSFEQKEKVLRVVDEILFKKLINDSCYGQ